MAERIVSQQQDPAVSFLREADHFVGSRWSRHAGREITTPVGGVERTVRVHVDRTLFRVVSEATADFVDHSRADSNGTPYLTVEASTAAAPSVTTGRETEDDGSVFCFYVVQNIKHPDREGQESFSTDDGLKNAIHWLAEINRRGK